MPMVDRTHAGLLDYLMSDTSVFDTQPTIHIGLSTTTPTQAGGNVTEPVGNAYARQAAGAAVWDAATVANPSVKDNGTAVTFPQATGSWGTITHLVVYDALTSGNVIAWGALSASKAVDTDDTLNFAAAAIVWQLTGA